MAKLQGILARLPLELLELILVQLLVEDESLHCEPLPRQFIEDIETFEWSSWYTGSKSQIIFNLSPLKPIVNVCRNLRRAAHSIIYKKIELEKTYPLSYTSSRLVYKQDTFFFHNVYSDLTDIPLEILSNVTYLSVSTESSAFNRTPGSTVYSYSLNEIASFFNANWTPALKYFRLRIHTKSISPNSASQFHLATKTAARNMQLRGSSTPKIQLHLCIFDSIEPPSFDPSFLKNVYFLTFFFNGDAPYSTSSQFLTFCTNVCEIHAKGSMHAAPQTHHFVRPHNINLNDPYSNQTLKILCANGDGYIPNLPYLDFLPDLLVCPKNKVLSSVCNLNNITSLHLTTSLSEIQNLSELSMPKLKNLAIQNITFEDHQLLTKFLSQPSLEVTLERLHLRATSIGTNVSSSFPEFFFPLLAKLTHLKAAHFYLATHESPKSNLVKAVLSHVCNHPSLSTLTLPASTASPTLKIKHLTYFINSMYNTRTNRIPSKPQFKLRFSVHSPSRLTPDQPPQSIIRNSKYSPQFLNSLLFLRIEWVRVSPYDIFGATLDIPESSCFSSSCPNMTRSITGTDLAIAQRSINIVQFMRERFHILLSSAHVANMAYIFTVDTQKVLQIKV